MDEFRLRDIERADLPVIWNWRNSEYIRKHMYNDQWIPWEDHIAWFEKEQQNPSSYAKLFIHKDRPLGVVRFTNVDLEHGTCEWGFYIGEQNAPKGAGTIMGLLALNFIFDKLGMRKVCAEVLDFNVMSHRYHKKLGFVQEGRFTAQMKRGDRLVDIIPMALFDEVWEERRKIIRRKVDGDQNR
ncbi:UDP-4-amino-4,6-dideoxy-N-acetyl-beta-L-altrosamine N-acetyltransferase [Halobacillus dabanensis]|uniref:UDP-4-amino-4,6-dideoxy-N-acetyl-beta-L-altrosamine N-acetyltransferase n=1 Tax=Halobacillus dabanensis TaxID=240302 RepID=A0A1I3U3Y1_HALDA|nr:UDP-4-amino-4,6-dideoxy-N-acetyl-beta-L-altrosamine N-acetyltransferase [Halobacillus dabanensis]SFJ77615.1 UDP-4-amino-4,6-dideoxy-N-acetyl-beta-L-altrosamine N-acetyltransferase [Halobacillus dabanensis]